MKRKSSKLVILGGEGDPRQQAAQTPFSNEPSDGKLPDNAFTGTAIYRSAGFNKSSQMFIGGASGALGSQASSLSQSPLYYNPLYSTPDKYYFPKDQITANRIWRMLYDRDSTIAIATDMYAELPWSEFDLEGIDDKEVLNVYQSMFEDLNLDPMFPDLTKDYLIHGELILHTLFNDTKGWWELAVSHNPDYIRVLGMGLNVIQPLLWLRPTAEMKKLVNNPDPRVQQYVKSLPTSLVQAVRYNQEIPLDPLNTTYIPRRSTSNSVRGTSMYTRLFRINMYEDFIYNASLAVSQRNAAPIRMFKIGDKEGNWHPTDDDINAFAEMLSVAESDPMAAVLTHPYVEVDYVGVSDKALLISREWEFIERVKLLSLGVAKSFLVGETSFAASVAGLQTLLERLETLRTMIERKWIIEKLCKPIAEIHGFYERTQSELEHRIRIQRPDERKLLIPKIKWRKSLKPTEDQGLLSSVWRELRERGVLSDRTYATGAGLDLDVERRNQIEELAYDSKKQQILQEKGIVTTEEAGPGGGGGMPSPPPSPPPAPEGAALHRRSVLSELQKDDIRREKQELLRGELENAVDHSGKLSVEEVLDAYNETIARNEETFSVPVDGNSKWKVQIPAAGRDLLTGK